MCSPICAYLRHKQLGFLMNFRCLRLGFFFLAGHQRFFVQTYGYPRSNMIKANMFDKFGLHHVTHVYTMSVLKPDEFLVTPCIFTYFPNRN